MEPIARQNFRAQQSKANVMVIDSAFISGALAFQVEEAAQMAIEEKPMGAILTQLQNVRDQSSYYIYGGHT